MFLPFFFFSNLPKITQKVADPRSESMVFHLVCLCSCFVLVFLIKWENVYNLIKLMEYRVYLEGRSNKFIK